MGSGCGPKLQAKFPTNGYFTNFDLVLLQLFDFSLTNQLLLPHDAEFFLVYKLAVGHFTTHNAAIFFGPKHSLDFGLTQHCFHHHHGHHPQKR